MMELTKRQQDIVDAAITVIARQGYKEFTVKNLAQSLQLTEAALYRHFESKNALVLAILDYFNDLSSEVIDSIGELKLSPLESVQRFVLNRYKLVSANPDLANVMFSEEMFRNDPSLTGQMQSIMHCHKEAVVGYIKAAQKAGDITATVDATDLFRIITGSMRFLVTQWNLSGHSFDLSRAGKHLFESIKKLIEVKK